MTELRTVEERLRQTLHEDADRLRPSPIPPQVLRPRVRRRAVFTLGTGALVLAVFAAGTIVGIRAIQRSDTSRLGTAPVCSWSSVPADSVEPDRLVNAPQALSVVSATDAWAVGDSFEQREGGKAFPLVEHFDGTAWHRVEVPDSDGVTMSGVAAVAPDDVWIAGFGERSGRGTEVALFHWDGSSWSTVPAPTLDVPYAHGLAAGASGPDDVWAVGNTARPNVRGSTLALRWDGSSWSVVPTPDAPPPSTDAPPYDGLQGVAVRAPGDAWAVGYSTTVPMAGQVTLIEHWDGRAWTLVPSPNVAPEAGSPGAPDNTLFGVAATASDDAWAVGQFTVEGIGEDIATATSRPLALHWDGAGWSVVPVPGIDEGGLSSVAAAAPNDVWAVGTAGGGTPQLPLALHWDGTRWTRMDLPLSPGSGTLDQVAVVPGGGILAVGTLRPPGATGGRFLALRCD